VDDEFFQQKDDMATGSSLSATSAWSILRNGSWLSTTQTIADCYVDTFVVWPHGPEQLHNFLCHLNGLRPSIQFRDSFLGRSGHQEGGDTGSSFPSKEGKPPGSVHIPDLKGVLEKSRCMENRCNFRRIFRTEHSFPIILQV
jgi:hypothetical protein